MTCDHYWREGVWLIERGDPDRHRETSEICRAQHELRGEMVRALPLVGSGPCAAGDWQAGVWRAISRLEASRSRHRRRLAGATSASFAFMMWWTMCHGGELVDPRVVVDVVPGAVAMRSTAPRVGDRFRIAVESADEVRVYLAETLVLRCTSRAPSVGCSVGKHGLVAELVIAAIGEYRVVVITSVTVEPVGRLDRDLGAVVAAGGDFQITELSVR